MERSFYCRSCRIAARGRWVPAGWYALERSTGGGARHLRVGLYCSLDCLAAAGNDLAAAEQDATRRGLPADTARDRARLTEIAQTLLHRGATIRAAGDELGVPTSTLRHWLREAGVRVGADGTLNGPDGPAAPRSGNEASGARGAEDGGGVPATADGGPDADPTAVQTLNELTQAGYVTELAWQSAADGAANQPVFTCTVTARVSGITGPVTARGTGGSKAAAKASAAAALLAALAEDDPAQH